MLCATPPHGKKKCNSFCATVITRNQINTCIPEKVIAETSGHKSSMALWCNERTSSVQQYAVTASMNSTISDLIALSWSLPIMVIAM